MLIVPIRHHSPAGALHVERLIRERQPRAVLVEGPADATALIPLLLDPETVPPVALYAYRGDESILASYYPFCPYSPEYVALQRGREAGAELRFCDLPAAITLARQEQQAPGQDDESEPLRYGHFAGALASAAGFDSFEEFWEVAFEQEAGAGSHERYLSLLTDFGSKARTFPSLDREGSDDLRERYMAAVAREVIAGGVPDESVMLVCGAAHAAAIAAAYASETPLPSLAAGAAVELTLIPYSFPRLSEQSGYGAGNRAPWYYQQIWEQQGDYAAAGRRALVELAQVLRKQGHAASLAQCIDAFNLAVVLAGMRGKPAAGVDEITEAAVATFGLGQAGAVSQALQQVLVGDAAGRVTPRVGRTPLQSEFYATTGRLRLPVLDAPRQVLLHMTIAVESEQSRFLHRLRLAGIPFAHQIESGLGGGRMLPGGPLEQLARVRERWELQWTPATDAALIERTAWGSDLAEVCRRLLTRQLQQAERIDTGVAVLLQMVICDLLEPFSAALDRCEALAADSVSFPALARATYQLDGLLAYGSARRLPAGRLLALAQRLFARTVLYLPPAAACSDEAAGEVEQTLTALYELAQRHSRTVEAGTFWAAVEQVAEGSQSHPALRGLALVLMDLGGRLPQDELARRLRYWLSIATEAGANARLVSGLFSLHRGTLVRNRSLIAAVTDFVLELEVEQLTPLLPVLRRTLGNLSTAERTYLSETLASVLGLEGGAAMRELTLTSADEALVREADAAVAAIVAGWKERYDIG